MALREEEAMGDLLCVWEEVGRVDTRLKCLCESELDGECK